MVLQSTLFPQAVGHNAPAASHAPWQELLAAARPMRPELLLVPGAAAALLWAAQPQLGPELHAVGHSISSPAAASLTPQQSWQQWGWQWPVLSAPALHGGAPGDAQPSGEGAERPFVLDAPTAAALGTCMVVSARPGH